MVSCSRKTSLNSDPAPRPTRTVLNTATPNSSPPHLTTMTEFCISATTRAETGHVLVTIQPPPELTTRRMPLDICCVIHTSGSMACSPTPNLYSTARVQLSALGLARHAVRSTVAMLQGSVDQLALVTFADDPKPILHPTRLDVLGCYAVEQALDEHCRTANGGSNISAGLRLGGSLLPHEHHSHQRALFLFTDGKMDHDHDYSAVADGKIPVYAFLLDGHSNISAPTKLHKISQRTGGLMTRLTRENVESTLANVVSMLQSTYARDCALTITPHWEGQPPRGRLEAPQASLHSLREHFDNSTNELHVHVGRLSYGCPKHVEVFARNSQPLLSKNPNRPLLTIAVSCTPLLTVATESAVQPQAITARVLVSKDRFLASTTQGGDEGRVFRLHAHRTSLLQAIKSLVEGRALQECSILSKTCLDELLAVKTALSADQDLLTNNDAARGMLNDITNEIVLNVNPDQPPDIISRLPLIYSLGLAYSYQTHIIDVLQGTRIFGAPLADRKSHLEVLLAPLLATDLPVDDFDDRLAGVYPPATDTPRPSFLEKFGARLASIIPSPQGQIVPCFDGSCVISVAGGGPDVRVDELQRGSLVQTPKGPARVAALVRTVTDAALNGVDLCMIGNLLITPWHPVRRDEDGDDWQFPHDLALPRTARPAAVYSVLLEREAKEHLVRFGGIWCVALGHGLQGSVVGHAFWGDWDRVHQALLEVGNSNGKLGDGVIQVRGVRRNREGHVVGFEV